MVISCHDVVRFSEIGLSRMMTRGMCPLISRLTAFTSSLVATSNKNSCTKFYAVGRHHCTTSTHCESATPCTEDLESRLAVLQAEMDRWRIQCGHKMPSQMTDAHWMEALRRETRSQRRKFYNFLRRKESRIVKRAEKKKQNESTVRTNDSRGTPEIAPYLLINQQKINTTFGRWHCEAVQFGPDLVVDLSFDEHMLQRESANCAQQIVAAYHCNRRNRHPFHLHLCNARDEQATVRYLRRYMKNLGSPDCLMSVHRSTYLDLFPTERIVYLTPHCDDELTEYNPESVYVIGGIVSTCHRRPLSLLKATAERLVMAKLPLDRYVRFENPGSKSLTLDQMMNVMLDLKDTGDFNAAFKHVPRRKLKS